MKKQRVRKMKVKLIKCLILFALLNSTYLYAETLSSPPKLTQLDKHKTQLEIELLNQSLHLNQNPTKKEHTILQELYQKNQGKLLWFSAQYPIDIINQVLSLYTSAPTQGLRSSDYYHKQLNAYWQKVLRTNPDFHEFAALDVALSLTFLRFLNDLHFGRIDPNLLGFKLKPKKGIDFAQLIYHAIQSNQITALVDSMPPQTQAYTNLKAALVRYRQNTPALNQLLEFSFISFLRPGDWSNQTNTLHTYFNNRTKDVAKGTSSDNLYIGELVKKVRKLQAEHNLISDGIIGKQTQALLNTPISEHIEKIEFAMERLRWLPAQEKGPAIFVNIPAFQLWAYNTEDPESGSLNMKVIVGRTKAKIKKQDRKKSPEELIKAFKALQTPIFTENLSFLTFNPYWNIPKSILQKEILPLLEKAPDYLQKQNMEIVDRFSHEAEVLPINEENISLLYNDQLRLRQRPGGKNSLGNIKFIFPNDYAIYLHDTPFRGLFKRKRRDFSHGCIRVEAPKALARFILKTRKRWSKEKTQEVLETEAPTIVGVRSQKIPVLIFYTTASASKTGINFYPDIYGHDSTLKSALTERSQKLTESYATKLAPNRYQYVRN